MSTYPTTALGRSEIAERSRLRSIARARRARQRAARILARWVILAAFLAVLGLAGHLEGLTP
jgi:hypothetical protein